MRAWSGRVNCFWGKREDRRLQALWQKGGRWAVTLLRGRRGSREFIFWKGQDLGMLEAKGKSINREVVGNRREERR